MTDQQESLKARALIGPPTPDTIEAMAGYLLRRLDPVVAAYVALSWAGESEEAWAAIERAAATEYLRRGCRSSLMLKLRETLLPLLTAAEN